MLVSHGCSDDKLRTPYDSLNMIKPLALPYLSNQILPLSLVLKFFLLIVSNLTLSLTCLGHAGSFWCLRKPPNSDMHMWSFCKHMHMLSCCLTSTEARWPIRDGICTWGTSVYGLWVRTWFDAGEISFWWPYLIMIIFGFWEWALLFYTTGSSFTLI